MPLSIDFLANVSRFLKGTGDAESALEDVGGALDDLASDAQRQASQTGDHIGSGIQDGTDDAERSVAGLGEKIDALGSADGADKAGDAIASGVDDGTDKAESSVDSLRSKFAELANASKSNSDSVGADLSHSVKKGSEEAEEGVKTAKENIGSNLKEVAASFDGTWSGVAGGAQGLIAEIAEGFGPAGLLAGAIAAGGIGLITSGMEDAEEKTEEAKQKVADLTGELLEAGSSGRRSLDQIQDKLKDLATTTDGQSLTTIWKDAKDAGLDYRGVVGAIVSGNAGDLGKEYDAVKKVTDGYYSELSAYSAGANGQQTALGNLTNKKLDASKRIQDSLRAEQKVAEDAEKAEAAAAAAGLTDYALKKGAIDQIHDAYADAAGEVDKYVDKESGLFDVTAYLKAMHRREEALRDYQETLATSKLSPEAKAYIESQGEEQAALMLAGYKSATDDQREDLNKVWRAAGRENANSYTDALGNISNYDVKPPKLLDPDSEYYKRKIREAQREAQQYLDDHPLRAGAIAYTSYGKPLY